MLSVGLQDIHAFGVRNAIQAELESLLMGLREIYRLKLSSCEVEGDSAVAISWGNEKCMGSWELAPIIYEIRELMTLLSILLVHVNTSRNQLADKLANWGAGSHVIFSGNSIPEGCL